ncbi:MAG: aminotransferase class V-fold PLP-dependent enzyme [Flavobacteriales bacterium]
MDGTQSVGAMHMDVMRYNIDALVCAGYKWLLGPYSIGMAYIGETFNDGIPLEETWMNRTNAQDFSHLTDYDPVYQPGAARYSIGESSQFILLPMLLEGVETGK